jgi:hypothetical protein
MLPTSPTTITTTTTSVSSNTSTTTSSNSNNLTTTSATTFSSGSNSTTIATTLAPTSCSNNPCQNGAICNPNGTLYYCTCVGNFTGMNCQTCNILIINILIIDPK